jgi:uncharacterized protein YkwD
MKKILTVRALAGAAAITLIATAAPASAVTSSDYEHGVITRTNVKRADNDRVAVKSQSCVDRYAERQASWMASHKKLEHQKLSPILDKCDLTGVSENIAFGFPTSSKVVSAWMASSGHRRNLLASKMRYIGVGAVQDSDGIYWVSQVFGTRK